MTDWRSMMDKEYLFAFDLQGRDVTVTIDRVKAGELVGEKGRKTKKPVVWFVGKEKPLAINMTNGRTIASMYGNNVEDWIGKRITIYPTQTEFGGKTCDCIRIRPTVPAVKAATGAAREPGEDG